MNMLDSLKLDKTAFTVTRLSDPSDEKAYWLSRSPYERLQAVEILRQLNYGYRQSTARLQRVLEVTQWNPERRVWHLRFDQTVKLGLKDPIVDQKGV